MMARPIHHFLKEFGSADTPPFQPPMPKPPAALAEALPEAPAPDLTTLRIQEAYQQGLAAGRALEREAAEAQAGGAARGFCSGGAGRHRAISPPAPAPPPAAGSSRGR